MNDAIDDIKSKIESWKNLNLHQGEVIYNDVTNNKECRKAL